MTPLQKHLQRACDELGLKVTLDYEHKLPSGRTIRSAAWIPNFGAPKGILVMTSSYTEHLSLLPELKRDGLTASFMGEGNEKSRYNLVSWMNTLADWTWTGPAEERPRWLDAVPSLFDEKGLEIDHSDFNSH